MVRRQLLPSVMHLLRRANPEMPMSRLQSLLRHYLADDDAIGGDDQGVGEEAAAGPDADADTDDDSDPDADRPEDPSSAMEQLASRSHRGVRLLCREKIFGHTSSSTLTISCSHGSYDDSKRRNAS